MESNQRVPLMVGWGITDRCNLSCPHCYSAAVKGGKDPIDTETARRTIDELGLLGTQRIGWTGGEPLLRRDLEELIAYAFMKHGIESGITTNGIPLTRSRAERLEEAGVKAIQISIDGSTPERNAAIRGSTRRQHLASLNAITAAREAGVKVHLAMLLGAQTLDDAPSFVDMARDYGVTSVRFCGYVPWGHGQDKSVRERLDLSSRLDEVRALVENFQSREDPIVMFDPAFGPQPPHYYYHECSAGMSMLYISGDGSVYPCTSLINDAFKVGNIQDNPLARIWNEPAMAAVATMDRSKLKGPCRGCDHFERCHGACRGITYAVTGDIEASFPNCLACMKPRIVAAFSDREADR